LNEIINLNLNLNLNIDKKSVKNDLAPTSNALGSLKEIFSKQAKKTTLKDSLSRLLAKPKTEKN
jgi:hypothetical protein